MRRRRETERLKPEIRRLPGFCERGPASVCWSAHARRLTQRSPASVCWSAHARRLTQLQRASARALARLMASPIVAHARCLTQLLRALDG